MTESALAADRWGKLPYDGGIWDQPAGLMSKLNQLYNVYAAHYSMVNTSLPMDQWSKRYPEYQNTTVRVAIIRRELNG